MPTHRMSKTDKAHDEHLNSHEKDSKAVTFLSDCEKSTLKQRIYTSLHELSSTTSLH